MNYDYKSPFDHLHVFCSAAARRLRLKGNPPLAVLEGAQVSKLTGMQACEFQLSGRLIILGGV